jgi:hypothetical protein
LGIQRRPVIFHAPPFIVYVTFVSRLSTCCWRPGDAERASWVSEAVYRSTQPDASFTWPDLVHDFKCNWNIKKKIMKAVSLQAFTLWKLWTLRQALLWPLHVESVFGWCV